MTEATIKKLNTINLDFYRKTAQYFDSSRQYYWDGWSRLLESSYLKIESTKEFSVLDVGCGNGRFAGFLQENVTCKINYTGIDSSDELLSKARVNYKSSENCTINFLNLDIINETLPPNREKKYDLIVLFGVLHHMPSFEKRVRILSVLKNMLFESGILVVSVWDFMNDNKLKTKLIGWSEVGVQEDEIEYNDYLLPWDRGVKAYRYCHYLSKQEEIKLLNATGLTCLENFTADGKSGKLNRYLILQ